MLIITSSRGEPMFALTRMVSVNHHKVEVGSEDFAIISARPIPDNKRTVGAVIDELTRRSCGVVCESMYEIHASDHACQEELEIVQDAARLKCFILVCCE